MSIPFTPFGNESDVIRIGNLEVENRLDRVSLSGDLVLTKDQDGLALALELHALATCLVQALQAEPELAQTVELKAVKVVKNPFA